ncbi:hypothetical protein BZG36_00811 [Bifiguratus adelaidae]|uniref:Protein kinase domain-containing protein n=1 Tax=Bifiguratus adelaidae TaxID=1938954 RepID=A0A261Y6P7_9FUNG|nr:hypothetical protein BZG36_00811 [Bifiguratus adelaidae]
MTGLPVIEQLKKFIRHGKNAQEPRQEVVNAAAYYRPDTQRQHIIDDPNSQNVSQAGHLLADTVPHDRIKTNTEAAARIVEEEKVARKKMPHYPGLERYELLEKMGDGAFSNVYKAYDTVEKRKVAVKAVRKRDMSASQRNRHLHPDIKKRPRATERANILKEVQIMRTVDHPSIIKLYDFFETPDYYFLILELMEGGELFHRIVHLTYFSEELSRHVIKQVAEGIRYLHEERGVIHRDIKPENLLFEEIPIIPSKTPKQLQPQHPDDEPKEDEGEFIEGVGGGGIGRIKIADFGLSKVVWDESTMTPCGTVGYTAPEIVKDERYSKAVDMWALGCVLYTLLCGFPPFHDESLQVLTEKVARGYYTFLSPWWDSISKEAKDCVSHLLEIDPRRRYTIDEFLAHPWMKGEKLSQTSVTGLISPAASKTTTDTTVPFTPEYAPSPYPQTPTIPGKPPKRKDVFTPGVVALKEVFDVSYAVHRMGEEKKPQGGAPGTALDGHDQDILEEEDDSDVENIEFDGYPEDAPEDQPVNHLMAQLDGAQIDNSQRNRKLNPEQLERVAQKLVQSKRGVAGPTASALGAPLPMQSGRQAPRVSGKRNRRQPFELDMNKATLLARRKGGVVA